MDAAATFPPLATPPEAADLPYAYTSLEELSDHGENGVAFGPVASLIYVEGELALYLDEVDTSEALTRVTDRDLALITAMVGLADVRVTAERRRRNEW